jgi:hypothetical protein
VAYALSILLFSAIHILGYIGRYSPLELTMAVLQYLPAGLCLAWSYTKAGTIFAPNNYNALFRCHRFKIEAVMASIRAEIMKFNIFNPHALSPL